MFYKIFFRREFIRLRYPPEGLFNQRFAQDRLFPGHASGFERSFEDGMIHKVERISVLFVRRYSGRLFIHYVRLDNQRHERRKMENPVGE